MNRILVTFLNPVLFTKFKLIVIIITINTVIIFIYVYNHNQREIPEVRIILNRLGNLGGNRILENIWGFSNITLSTTYYLEASGTHFQSISFTAKLIQHIFINKFDIMQIYIRLEMPVTNCPVLARVSSEIPLSCSYFVI